ncbi:hypothetical protein [Vibrio ziniensis]|uniref:Uncharacterized protein n=1 Tax=Vibrio ziniensis TaxID=2711221 RepID=A0A6G7CMW7_9VIBR|nr:hypothetical protein [Vibrio ziniensis]QIH43449.1 hypothetical protein G5S32_15745 [Vibrio ziniensis]
MAQYRIVGDGFAADVIENSPNIEGADLIGLVLRKAYRQLKQQEANSDGYQF